MQTKLTTICVLVALGAASTASAENLVDRSSDDHAQSSGSILDFFKSKGGSPEESRSLDAHGCGTIINAAGDAVYVNRPGCPRS